MISEIFGKEFSLRRPSISSNMAQTQALRFSAQHDLGGAALSFPRMSSKGSVHDTFHTASSSCPSITGGVDVL